MISFKNYIIESSNIAQSLEQLKQFKPLLSAKFGEKLDQDIAVLIKAADEKLIYNARYGEATSGILNFVQRCYSTIDKTLNDFRKDHRNLDIPYSLYTVSDIKKASKEMAKVSNLPEHAKKFFSAIKDIPEVFAIIKGYIQKGKPPKEPKPGQFIKPMASFNASKTALNFMKEAASSFEKELHKNIEDQVTSAFNKIKDSTKVSDIPKDPNSKAVASIIFSVKHKDGEKVLALIPNANERIKNLINDNVRNIVDGFVSKSASKLALILEKKGSPKDHSIVNTNIRNGMVENTMKFEFEDNSSFVLESSVVYKYSQTGKLFFQYPTRFKNVKLSDGSQMKMPSEEKMIKEF